MDHPLETSHLVSMSQLHLHITQSQQVPVTTTPQEELIQVTEAEVAQSMTMIAKISSLEITMPTTMQILENEATTKLFSHYYRTI